MKTIEVECYSDESNYVIVRTPGRNFPGMVVQGDALRSLLRTIQRAESLLTSGNSQEALAELEDIKTVLNERCSYYERVLEREGFGLPYPDGIRNIS